MNEMVQKKIKEYKSDGGVQSLTEALQAVYSRPNDDAMVEKVTPPLRSELDETEQWETAVDVLVQEAIGALKNPKAFKPVVQNTYAVFLENIVADFKPFAEKDGHKRKVIQKIRDAKIEMTKEALNERKLRDMKNHRSPSELAAQVMDSALKAEAEAKKADAEANKKKKK